MLFPGGLSFGVAFVFFLGFIFGRTSFLVVFFGAVFFFALIFGGITFLGFFFGGMFFLGLDFSGVSVIVVISAGFMMAGLVTAGSCGVAITPDVVGLFVVLCNCGSALLSMSGAGSGRG